MTPNQTKLFEHADLMPFVTVFESYLMKADSLVQVHEKEEGQKVRGQRG